MAIAQLDADSRVRKRAVGQANVEELRGVRLANPALIWEATGCVTKHTARGDPITRLAQQHPKVMSDCCGGRVD